MKKILFAIVFAVSLVGCGKLSKSPTNIVESFLNNYQTLDQKVLEDLDKTIPEDYTLEQKEEYKKIIKKNYQKLTYEIKEEEIDGDKAVVTVSIDVVDYSKINNEIEIYLLNNPNEFLDEDSIYDNIKANEYRISKLKEANETVTYTLELELHKNNKDWVLDDLDEIELSKINGTYKY